MQNEAEFRPKIKCCLFLVMVRNNEDLFGLCCHGNRNVHGTSDPIDKASVPTMGKMETNT